jgi:hypothetical protein
VLQLVSRSNAAPKCLKRYAQDEVIKTRSHNLIDGRGNALAHILHMLEQGLLSIEWSLFDGRACHVIGDAPWPQYFALRLHCGVGGRHHNTNALSKSQTIWHGMAPCLKRALHATPLSLKSSKSQIAPLWL